MYKMPADDNFRFIPPLYNQRYFKVLDILCGDKPRKVIDFGCAECSLIKLLKGEDYIEEICGVDINGNLLESFKKKIEPLTSDYINPRANPLTIRLMQGSVLVATECLKHFDAVTCIELIEHLYPSQLPALKENLFGYIKPKLVIISTPNADFNVLFPKSPEIESKMRHWDHKFEWTRKEFQSWCLEISKIYSYSVVFDGVGKSPNGQNEFGFCSQFAIFRRIQNDKMTLEENNNTNTKSYQNLIAISEHPFRTVEDQKEIQLFSAYFSCLDALSSAIRIMLITHTKKNEEKTNENNILDEIAALKLTCNQTTPSQMRFRKKELHKKDTNQFSDVEGDGVYTDFASQNTYGHEYYQIVIDYIDSAYEYIQNLRHRSSLNKNGFPNLGQYDDSESDFSQYVFMTKPLAIKPSYVDVFTNLSDYNPQFLMPVRMTDRPIEDDWDSLEHIVVYKRSELVKVPLQFILVMEDMKSLLCDVDRLRSLVQKKGPDGVEISIDDENALLIEIQTLDSFGRCRRLSRASSTSSCYDDNEYFNTPIPTCTDEEFFEENWDCD